MRFARIPYLLVTLVCLFAGAVADGATPAVNVGDASSLSSVTTSVAVRARAEMQIRRLRGMIASKASSNDDALFSHLEHLEQQLRGEK